ncbi:MAG: DNA polymerase III subunit beta [Syntrophotaleaceae bacterium]
MHFSIEKEVFLRGLARVQGIVEKKNTIPILSNVLIEAGDGEIHLTATDLEVGMKATYPANVTTAGKITVSAKKLFEIIKELPEKEIDFNAKDNCWIEIRCGKAFFNIVGLSAEEFPFFPNFQKEQFFRIDGGVLKEMIDKTSFSISTDESKYNLNGIYFRSLEVDGRPCLRLVATDGHRLALVQKDIDVSHIEQLSRGVIFPRKGIHELRKMADESNGDLQLGFLDNNAVIQKEQTVVVMRLVDGEFPDYDRVIPKSNEMVAVIPTDTFLHALRRMSILSSEKSKGVRIVLRTNLLEMSSSNPEFGDAREDFDIEYNGEEIAVGFNARYLIDILNAQSEPKVRMALKDKLSPGMVTPVNTADFLTVIMPMRL